MKKYIYTICLFSVLGCTDEKPESYPIEPVITSVGVTFHETPALSDADTLALTISFTDGDGDLGFQGEFDTLAPFHRYNFFDRQTGEEVPSDMLFKGLVGINQLIRLSDRANPPYDTLPDPQSACYVYEITHAYSDPPHHVQNPDFLNIFIDFLYEDANGQMVEFDFFEEFCMSFDGRFLHGAGTYGPFIMKMNNANKGQLTFNMTSIGFKHLFGDKKMKLRIYVKDHALRRSNVAETEVFKLDEI